MTYKEFRKYISINELAYPDYEIDCDEYNLRHYDNSERLATIIYDKIADKKIYSITKKD